MTLALIDLLAIYYQNGNLELMEVIARTMLTAVPNDPVALQFLGLTLYQKGRTEDAKKIFRYFAAITDEKSHPHPVGTSCELAATASYQAAVRPGSGLATGWEKIASICQRLGYASLAVRARKAAGNIQSGFSERTTPHSAE